MKLQSAGFIALLAMGCEASGSADDREDAAGEDAAGEDAAVEPEAPPTDEPEPIAATEHALVVTQLRFSDVISPGVAPGFDLDGFASDGRAENGGCQQVDQVGPDGSSGIDNQLATLMPIFRATEAAAIDGQLQESVNGGMILYVAQLSGMDAWEDDPAVDLTLQAASGPAPYLGTHGFIESDQTFQLDPAMPANRGAGGLVAGTFTSEVLSIRLPVRILNADFLMQFPLARMQFTLNPDGSADGIFGGAMPIQALIDLANGVNTSIRDLATTLLTQKADLLPGEDGRCTAISAWFTFHAERAFVADW